MRDFSKSISPNYRLEELDYLKLRYPDSILIQHRPDDDIKGADYTVSFDYRRPIGIDVKRREGGASQYWKGDPEVCLEVWSAGKPGWAKQRKPLTDVIMAVFNDLPHFCYFFDARTLVDQFNKHEREWRSRYGLFSNKTKGKHEVFRSTFVPVPIETLRAVMEGHYHIIRVL